MAEVIWERSALDDLDGIIVYIPRFNPDAALDVGDRLRRCGESLSVFPQRGRPALAGHREMTTVPPYVLTYQVDTDTVHILSIRHGARRPLD